MQRSLRATKRAVWVLAASALCFGGRPVDAAAQAAGLSANVRDGGIDSHQTEQAGSRIRRGRAMGIVAAPIDKVTAVVSDYKNYHQFMPHFVTSRVLSQRGSQALLYVEVSALHGAAKLWAEMKLRMEAIPNPRASSEPRC